MTVAASKKSRVLIVEDSTFMRRVLKDILSADPQLEVAGQACDGREGVALAESLRPDVITMDINMPHLDGLQATELIMSQNPRPIVIVSSESREGTKGTLKALELGAIDFVTKPSSGVDLDMKTVAEELRRKVKMAAKVRVVRTASRSSQAAPRPPMPAAPALPSSASLAQSGSKFPTVMLAASTGGPAAVMRIAAALPKEFPAAVFVIIHMPAAFTQQFAVQLAEVSALPVKEAEANEAPQPGVIYLCPGSHHLRLSAAGKITLDAGPRVNGYRPCADTALESLASYARALGIAVVLTGMAGDGANGAKAVKDAGGCVLAQDEATSVIFGMPADAIKAGAVDEVLPLDEIGPAIEKRVVKLLRLTPVGVR